MADRYLAIPNSSVMTITTTIIGLLTSTYIFLWALVFFTQDSKEPPLVPTLLPFIGPMIGMKRRKGRFYTYMNDKYHQPIYTLRVASARLYVVNSTQEAVDIVGSEVADGNEATFLSGFIKAVRSSLSPGAALDKFSTDAIANLEAELASLAAQSRTTVQLYDFVRRAILTATTESIEARELLVKAFDKYLAARGQDQASEYVQQRVAYFAQQGIPMRDISRFEIAGLIALNTNTIPMATLIDYEHIRDSCPILHSTFQEVFRIHGIGLVPRRVLADHMLNDRYLLKKGGTFDHKRFIKKPGSKTHNPAAFRGFGNGFHLCPGRHFATAEILSFVAMLLLRFDITATSGKWPEMTVEKSSQVSALDQPDDDFDVEIVPRGGVTKQKWSVVFPTAKKTRETS
ncbi:cytochrome P450 [Astrocystis sublimbata]|nr:cytochrome P450 [Astrocystis sublimbata]